MTVPRLAAIVFILIVATLGWMVLGGSVNYRTNAADTRGHDAVSGLWGQTQVQSAPGFTAAAGRSVELVGSDIVADFELEQRRKGLLWYSTYNVDLDAAYRVRNAGDEAANAQMALRFPTPDGVYDGFAVSVDGREVPVVYLDGKALADFTVAPGETVEIETGYQTNGLDEWRYLPSPEGVGVIEDFTLTMRTDFDAVDFPGDAVSPTTKEPTGDGWNLTWHYDSLVSGRPVALLMPKPLNPGPVAERISFFAPVSLLFYFASLVLLTATQKVRVHPMNYAFLAGGFFAFHLLFAYLVDRVDLTLSFVIASLTSLVLCVGYLSIVLGRNRALAEIAVGQFVFLVLFSYSFFFEGLTGLAVTIGSILTLAFFMVKTGRVDWEDVFKKARPDQHPGWNWEPALQPEGPSGAPGVETASSDPAR